MPKPDEFLTFEICVQVFVASVSIYLAQMSSTQHCTELWEIKNNKKQKGIPSFEIGQQMSNK